MTSMVAMVGGGGGYHNKADEETKVAWFSRVNQLPSVNKAPNHGEALALILCHRTVDAA